MRGLADEMAEVEIQGVRHVVIGSDVADVAELELRRYLSVTGS